MRAALAVLEDAGFEGLTMRPLAERLGIQAASLYNHVRDKNDLLTLVADAISGEIREIDPGLSWRGQLDAVARDYRRVLLAHRDGARVLTATPPLGPKRLRIIDQVLQIFCRAGLGDEVAADAAFVFNTFVTGFVLDESQMLPRGGGQQANVQQMAEQLRQWYRSLPPDRYPTIVALADHLFDATMERRFQFGLAILLDGLEARLTRASP